MTDKLQQTDLLIQCAADAPECVVRFEPEGASHVLRSGEFVRLRTVLPVGYEIEVAYGPGWVSVWAEQTWGTRAFLADGTELQI